jgi:hypothetical protein
MGDRAIVVFWDGDGAAPEFSPAVYTSGMGARIGALLREALPDAVEGVPMYASARFAAHCCNAGRSGGLGVGLFNIADPTMDKIKSKGFSHGDAGVFLVNTKTWRVENYNGYGFNFEDPEDYAGCEVEPGNEDRYWAMQLDADKPAAKVYA